MSDIPIITGMKRVKTSSTYLIVDTRERAVVPFLETELKEFAYVLKQINTGDYLICEKPSSPDQPPVIKACIERKTYVDFAASFKDGRYRNTKKMLALRQKTGCQLYFFVEGPAFPSPGRRFARIPYANILAAITKLMVHDGMFVVQTENECHTAKRLAEFLHTYEFVTMYSPPATIGGDVAASVDADASSDADTALVVPEILTARIEQTDCDGVVNMWARLRGISVVLGKILTREFSIAELATQRVGIDRIRVLKTATGRTINKDAVTSLLAIRSGSDAQAVKLISGIRYVTPEVARHILCSKTNLSTLCNTPAVFLTNVLIPRKTSAAKLGKIRAERIWRLLHYKEGEVADVQDSGHVLSENSHPDPVEEDQKLSSTNTYACDATPLPDEDVDAILAEFGIE